MLKRVDKKLLSFFILIIVVGLFFRIYHIEFGLPHSFYADEPEISEPAIKYTFELKDILRNNDYYKLIPVSFVYGTFPVYVFTIATMGFSKIVGSISKTDIFIFLRVFNALISLLLIPLAAFIYYKLFKDKLGTLITAFLIALNWKLIVMGHYLNQDIFLTVLLTFAFAAAYQYYKRTSDTKYTLLTGIFFGLAVGTKITALITFPLFLYLFVNKKDYKGVAAFILVTLGSFAMSNPFAIILHNNFVFRIYSLFFKEGGLVFDSVDSNPLKYIYAFGLVLTPIILIASLYGKFTALKKKENLPFHLFLIANMAFYLIFFSLQSRRVDRWLLPMIPVAIIYASYGLSILAQKFRHSKAMFIVIIVIFLSYIRFPLFTLSQFQKNTPKSSAYLWLKDHVKLGETVLAITEEGLDPINKIPLAKVVQFQVYVSSGAQYNFPLDPTLYKYVVLASRPMTDFKRQEVVKEFPLYASKWQMFENTILDETKFKLRQEFVLSKPNLIPLSDVFIYENLK